MHLMLKAHQPTSKPSLEKQLPRLDPDYESETLWQQFPSIYDIFFST